MNYWDKVAFVKDLSDFIKLIEELDLPFDISSVYNLQGKIEYDKAYIINVEDVVFNVNSKIAGTIPIEVESLSIYFDHFCEIDQFKDFSTQDLIKKGYIFRLKLVGRDKEKREYVNWWRLDQDEEGPGSHKTIHPYYHFHSGGDELIGVDTGSNLFLSAPRLAHPPMDIFLGFHFIINNFYNRKCYEFVDVLMGNETYQDIINRAQNRLWVPYFNSFNRDSTHTHFNFAKVFPLYMIVD